MGNSFKYVKNEHNVVGTFDFIFHRSLTEHEYQEQNYYPNTNDKLLDEGDNKNEKYGIYYVSPYEQLSKRASKHMGVLQRNSKNRFGKKRGLAKVDHYFEKEIFHKLDDIYDLEKKWNSEKKFLKKKIFMKYGIRYILIFSLPVLGLILPMLFGINKFGDGILAWCGANKKRHKLQGNSCKLQYFNEDAVYLIYYINSVFFVIISFIVLFVFFYTLRKIIKYERIKAIKGKMSLKEYCNFCKEVIRKT
ncbi:hypothetical protein PVMG_06049 [Plasmodium vivax Mauritania I]|uniref:Variable surface protein n=1 Tax=Plasmodium vivax Mauritania I TaxID=1035515 RepID=A0A0J9W3Q9_PLAVI|nr:hypothetical protein PVMG_06049 [Plasmodium vivax Mauritania I]